MERNAQEALPNKQACRLATLLQRDELTLASIAAELNAYGYRTRRGKKFHKITVMRLLQTSPSVRNHVGGDVEKVLGATTP